MPDARLRRDRDAGFGARTWYFPDGDLPPMVDGPAEPHEALFFYTAFYSTPVFVK